jgi:uncharacterized protein (DUF736 family)
MYTIGTFKSKGNGFTGHIETLTFNKAARLEPVTEKRSEKSPDYRVKSGRNEIGAAWVETPKGGESYLSVCLDDPSFTAPIYCRMFMGAG